MRRAMVGALVGSVALTVIGVMGVVSAGGKFVWSQPHAMGLAGSFAWAVIMAPFWAALAALAGCIGVIVTAVLIVDSHPGPKVALLLAGFYFLQLSQLAGLYPSALDSGTGPGTSLQVFLGRPSLIGGTWFGTGLALLVLITTVAWSALRRRDTAGRDSTP